VSSDELRAAIVQIGYDLNDESSGHMEATRAYERALARFLALTHGSSHPLTAGTAQFLTEMYQAALYMEGRTTEVIARLEQYAAML